MGTIFYSLTTTTSLASEILSPQHKIHEISL